MLPLKGLRVRVRVRPVGQCSQGQTRRHGERPQEGNARRWPESKEEEAARQPDEQPDSQTSRQPDRRAGSQTDEQCQARPGRKEPVLGGPEEAVLRGYDGVQPRRPGHRRTALLLRPGQAAGPHHRAPLRQHRHPLPGQLHRRWMRHVPLPAHGRAQDPPHELPGRVPGRCPLRRGDRQARPTGLLQGLRSCRHPPGASHRPHLPLPGAAAQILWDQSAGLRGRPAPHARLLGAPPPPRAPPALPRRRGPRSLPLPLPGAQGSLLVYSRVWQPGALGRGQAPTYLCPCRADEPPHPWAHGCSARSPPASCFKEPFAQPNPPRTQALSGSSGICACTNDGKGPSPAPLRAWAARQEPLGKARSWMESSCGARPTAGGLDPRLAGWLCVAPREGSSCVHAPWPHVPVEPPPGQAKGSSAGVSEPGPIPPPRRGLFLSGLRPANRLFSLLLLLLRQGPGNEPWPGSCPAGDPWDQRTSPINHWNHGRPCGCFPGAGDVSPVGCEEGEPHWALRRSPTSCPSQQCPWRAGPKDSACPARGTSTFRGSWFPL
ncbi:mitochondrial dicarboxylate carrier isoform X1 [Pelodiscus sinensis]|uniref:mitochondrial dicarboxylate carrier isoform X1 n=1 Tax=Pelodiscus sinensis TaxID=13735 RepID=UPI003F6AB210